MARTRRMRCMSANSADKLREELEQDIVTGVIKPGERLDEVQLANRFSVSRTPIREALQRLSMSGLVDLRPRRGAFVREISLSELVEMFDVMAELEGMCARLAARRITAEQGAQMKALLQACNEAAINGDTDGYYHANADFHSHIYQSSQNSFLAEQAKTLHTRLAPYRRLQLRVLHRMRQSLSEHQAVTDAILSGDAEQAEAAIKSHVCIQGDKFSDLAAQFSERG